VNAAAITLGVMLSVTLGWCIVTALGASPGMLSLSVFLSMQAGNMVKDQSARSRLATTALLLPAVVAAIACAAALSHLRLLAMSGFILVTGLAIWVRRFGPRASAMGAIAFNGYFFTLFVRPEGKELVPFLLLVACAVGAQVLVRSLLLITLPRREVRALMHELRAASLALLTASAAGVRPAQLRPILARIDDVGMAIWRWQGRYRTSFYVASDAEGFEATVLDARVDTEEACVELVRLSAAERLSAPVGEAVLQLRAVLSPHASAQSVDEAVHWATRFLTEGVTGESLAKPVRRVAALLAGAVLTHARLRAIDLRRGLEGAWAVEAHKVGARTRPVGTRRGPVFRPWREWSMSSRMTLQAMIAATLASVVGEMISADRWYWAVMTAFVIFIGTSTRGGILTRAYRRILGSVAGIAVGAALVALSGDSTLALSLIAVVSVFGMVYFGPVNYLYTSLFVSVMLVSIYRMLGILDAQLLELRTIETLAGAVIGVLAAYAILSSSSRPVLAERLESYMRALEAMLRSVQSLLHAPADSADALRALHELESHQAAAEQTVAGMSAAFLFRGSRHQSATVHLLHVVTRAAARLTQSVGLILEDRRLAIDPEARASIEQSIVTVLRSAAAAQHTLQAELDRTEPASTDTPAAAQRPPGMPSSAPSDAALSALARMNWALLQLADPRRGERRALLRTRRAARDAGRAPRPRTTTR